jgi:hypothetical protein
MTFKALEGSSQSLTAVISSPYNSPQTFEVNSSLPTVEVTLMDPSGSLYTSASVLLVLTPFRDSECKISDADPHPESSSTVNGKAQFTGMTGPKKAGDYYIQISGPSVTPACSALVRFQAGPPVQLSTGRASYDTTYLATRNSPVSITAQVSDAFGNAVSLQNVHITFSSGHFFDGTQTSNGTYTPSYQMTDASGRSTVSYLSLPDISSDYTLVRAATGTVSAYPDLSNKTVLIPVQLTPPTTLDAVSITEFPSDFLSGSSHWVRLSPQSSYGVPLSGSTGDIVLAPENRTIQFSSSDVGVKWARTTASYSDASISANVIIAGVSKLNSFSIFAANSNCSSSAPFFWKNSIPVGIWGVFTNWINGGSVDVGPPASFGKAEIGPAFSGTITLNSSADVGCVRHDSGSLDLNGNTLRVALDQYTVGDLANIQDSLGSGALKFSVSGTYTPQQFMIPKNRITNLPKLIFEPYQTNQTFTVDEQNPSEGPPLGYLNVNTLEITPSSFSVTIYINTHVKVTQPIVLSGSAGYTRLVINPNASLTALGGMTIGTNGILTVRSQGKLVIGGGGTSTGQLLVGSYGSLQLLGEPGTGREALVQPYDAFNRISIEIGSAGSFEGRYFKAFALGTSSIPGIQFNNGANLLALRNARFLNLADSGYGIQIKASVNFKEHLKSLTFISDGVDPNRYSPLVVDSAQIGTFGVVSSYFGYSNSSTSGDGPDIKGRSIDDGHKIIWDF